MAFVVYYRWGYVGLAYYMWGLSYTTGGCYVVHVVYYRSGYVGRVYYNWGYIGLVVT